jgi:two-component system NtrC family response regulator
MESASEFARHVFLGLTAVLASPTMHRLLSSVERIARANASVLILGESGSGKEMIARALHHYSRRASKPWVDISCAALPEQLLESELFGHERGAFSGADQAKPGLFELADQGTLFLDEVAELDPRMQVKLLRVLDGVSYYRVGGVKKVSVDVRVVAATNRDLDAAVGAGQFRQDLFHRLSQVTVTVPPLRQRREDIGPLAAYFLGQHDPALRLTSAAITRLEAYAWPGNVRELRNVVLQAAVLSEGIEIDGGDLRFRGPPSVAPGGLDDMERRMILEALEKSGGHQQRAAQQLGISRRTLSRKVKQYQEDALEVG